MKLIYIISFLVASLSVGCSQDELEMFTENYFIKFQFNRPNESDYYRINYSFAYQDDTVTKYKLPIPVEYVGRDLSRMFYFGVAADKDKTTLPEDCYTLNLEQPFRMGNGNIDTLWITLLRKPVLQEDVKMLRLQLVPNSDFQLYMQDSVFVEIYVSDIFSRPNWWDYSVENAYLGTFSKLKYDEFVKETGIRDFGALDPSEKRYYCMVFKRALETNPRSDENGELMIIALPG